MQAYGIFQGGGAKGYAHVGALKAAEERGITFVRYAGTSAGAIIATLAAAGYRADDLLNPEKPFGTRGILDLDIAELLAPAEYDRVRRIRQRLFDLNNVSRPKSGPIGAWQKMKREVPLLWWLRLFRNLACEFGTAKQIFRQFGVVGTEEIVRWLDGMLADKLGVSGPVTFGQLDMRLRMVAANLTTGRIEKFGFTGDESVEVAPATVASACFPFFFRPVTHGQSMFLDGGLVSNLPVWLFDDERDDDSSHLPTFGFRLVNDALVAERTGTPTRFLPFSARMVQTVLSGARQLEERRIDYYHGIDLEASVGTLSFDTAREKAPELVRNAKRCVEDYFTGIIGPQDPGQIRRILSIVTAELIDHLDWPGRRVRTHVLLPDADQRHARTIYSYNMEESADDHLRVRTDIDGTGAVFRLREPIYASIDSEKPGGPGPLKYEFGARPPWVAGVYAIPIFDTTDEWEKPNCTERSMPSAAFVIDSDVDFADAVIDPTEQDVFANVAAIVGEEIRDRNIVRKASSPYHKAEPVGWDRTFESSSIRLAARKVRDAGDGDLGRRIGAALQRLTYEAPSQRLWDASEPLPDEFPGEPPAVGDAGGN